MAIGVNVISSAPYEGKLKKEVHSVGKPKLGKKHICLNCEARFFDLGKTPVVCPKCGTEVVVEKPKKKRSKKAKTEEAAAAALAEEKASNAPAAEDDDEDEDIDDITADDDDDDDDEEGLMEDTSDITGNADEDLEEVLDNVQTED